MLITKFALTPMMTPMTVQLREIEKGQRYELDVEAVPPLPESGAIGSVILETDLKTQPTVLIPVYGVVQPRVYLSPKIISVPTPGASDLRRTINLMLVDGTKVDVTDVETSNPTISAVVEPANGSQPRQIRLTIPKGTELPAKGETLSVHTNDPAFATLVCEIRPFRLSRPSATMPANTQPPMSRLAGVSD